MLSAKKRVYKLSDSVKQRQQLRFVHVHQLGYGQLMQPSAPAHEDDVVEVRLAGWEASAYVPFRQLTDRVTVDVRTFHTFSDKVKVAEDGDKERQAALIPTVFALEVALSSTVMQGLVHPILDLYAACGVELEEEEVRIIANGRELTSPVPAASSSVLIVDTALVPFAPLLLIVDPQSSFTLDPASSTSSSLLLSPSHLTVSITSDSKWSLHPEHVHSHTLGHARSERLTLSISRLCHRPSFAGARSAHRSRSRAACTCGGCA